jgi:hypothetical protein
MPKDCSGIVYIDGVFMLATPDISQPNVSEQSKNSKYLPEIRIYPQRTQSYKGKLNQRAILLRDASMLSI